MDTLNVTICIFCEQEHTNFFHIEKREKGLKKRAGTTSSSTTTTTTTSNSYHIR